MNQNKPSSIEEFFQQVLLTDSKPCALCEFLGGVSIIEATEWIVSNFEWLTDNRTMAVIDRLSKGNGVLTMMVAEYLHSVLFYVNTSDDTQRRSNKLYCVLSEAAGIVQTPAMSLEIEKFVASERNF